jgi:N-acetylmuramoyl-L-alanine amidase
LGINRQRAFNVISTSLPHIWVPSPNFGDRKGAGKPDILLLHYTGMPSGQGAVKWLCMEQSGVSCHYLVDVDGSITQMVCESKRAWHAGKSFWHGDEDVNSRSVGIEIQNEGPLAESPEFPDGQIKAVVKLSQDIISRHQILPSRVLAHSDVAIGRKVDPGEKFPWDRLAQAGVGIWPQIDKQVVIATNSLSAGQVQDKLAAFGYKIARTGQFDDQTRRVVEAFQRHFRPGAIDGIVDKPTSAILKEFVPDGTV